MYIHKHFSANNIAIEEFPFSRELAMEAYLLENESVLSLETAGLDDVTVVESEVTLLEGRIVNDGRIDILATYGQDYIAVVELKMGKLTRAHLNQLEEYLTEKEQILTRFPDIWDNESAGNPKWIGIMVGKTIDPDLMLKIRQGYRFNDEIPIAALTINRYKGKEGNIYVVSDTFFVEQIRNRDLTQYVFNGNTYGKGRLVLAVVKDYVSSHQSVTFIELKNVFPNYLQSPNRGGNVFTTYNDAIEICNRIIERPHKRHYIEPTEIIQLVDETIAVSNQWGTNINEFINYCNNNLNLNIIPLLDN